MQNIFKNEEDSPFFLECLDDSIHLFSFNNNFILLEENDLDQVIGLINN